MDKFDMGRILRKFRYKQCLFVLCFCLSIYIILFNVWIRTPNYGSMRHFVRYPNKYFREKQVKKILLWTNFFENSNLDSYQQCLSTCDAKCVATGDKTEVTSADAVVFHISNLWAKHWKVDSSALVELPSWRTPDQVWVVWNLEPPSHLWGDVRPLNGLFNWTQWYRADSDIMTTYGHPSLLDNKAQKQAAVSLKTRNFFREKSKLVFLRISNCHDPGRRYRVIRELNKYMDIDKYGKCYNRQCGSSSHPSDEECDKVLKPYKFYLALENDDCTDYVTEKYWNTLRREQIPIVNWRHVNSTLVIPNSYINLFDFKDLRSAADYILKVAQDEDLYNSYFRYRLRYTDVHSTCPGCKVCRRLHDQKLPAQVYTDLDAWVRSDVCPKVGVRCVRPY